MPKTNRTKKQHYIAQSIIKEFFDVDSLYEKNIHSNNVYKTSIKNTMCMSNSYEVPLLEDNSLEDLFATSIDVDSSKMIKELKRFLDKRNYEEAKKTIFKKIRIFLINYYKSVTSLIHMSADMSKKDDSSIIRMIKTIFNMPYIDRISEILCKEYDFAIIKSFSENFVLSDQFIATCSLKFMGRFVNISNREIGLKNTVVLIPISKKYYGIFVNGSLPDNFNIDFDSINELSESQTNAINNIIFNNSYEKCISQDETTINNLEKKNSSYGDLMAMAKFDNGNLATFKIKQEVFFTDDEFDLYQYFGEYEWANSKFKICGVNSLCPCGSNRKYKKCCKDKVERCNKILNTMHFHQQDIMINSKLGFENPIQLSNLEQTELQEKFKFLSN